MVYNLLNKSSVLWIKYYHFHSSGRPQINQQYSLLENLSVCKYIFLKIVTGLTKTPRVLLLVLHSCNTYPHTTFQLLQHHSNMSVDVNFIVVALIWKTQHSSSVYIRVWLWILFPIIPFDSIPSFGVSAIQPQCNGHILFQKRPVLVFILFGLWSLY